MREGQEKAVELKAGWVTALSSEDGPETTLNLPGAASGSALGGARPVVFLCNRALLSLPGDSRLAAILQQLTNHATANAGPLGAVPLSGSQLAAGGLSSEPSSPPRCVLLLKSSMCGR